MSVRVYDSLGTQLRREEMTLSPLETKRFTFSGSSEQPVTGYLVLEYSRQIASSARYEGRNAAAEIDESVGVIPNKDLISHSEFIVDVAFDDKLNTGIALVPDMVEELEAAEVGAVLFNDLGVRIGETTVSLGKHYSKFVSDIFPDLEKPFRGYMLIQHGGSYNRVHALALLIEYRSGGWELTALPIHSYN